MTTDGRYEALLAHTVVRFKHIDRPVRFDDLEPYKSRIPAFALVVDDRVVMEEISMLMCSILSARRLERLSLERGEPDPRASERAAEYQAALDQHRRQHPSFVSALEACYAVYNKELYSKELASLDEGLADIIKTKKRKQDEYADYCRDAGREPTPEPAPAAPPK